MQPRLLPPDHPVPPPLINADFVFEVLGPEHNGQDHPAWTQSIEHIKSTPGFAGRAWPADAVSLSQNLRDLERHRDEYAKRASFAYAVLAAEDGAYVGCVYFCPPRTGEFDVDVRSWVRKERAALDEPLHAAVKKWLDEEWPWTRPDYADRRGR